MQIGEQIRTLRKKQGLTQAVLAERLYVTPQAVSQWERGTTIPDMEKLNDIATVLHTTANMLTGEENPGKDWNIADTPFSPEHMYSRLVSTAQIEKLSETYTALPYMKEKHAGQTGNSFSQPPLRTSPKARLPGKSITKAICVPGFPDLFRNDRMVGRLCDERDGFL